MTHAAPQTSAQANPSTSNAAPKKRERLPLNGVNTPALFETLGVVKEHPELAEFTFRAKNEWISATHSRTTYTSFSGAGGDHTHQTTFSVDSDHPAVLVGRDNGATPVEHVLHALASCIMAGIGNISAARGIRLESVDCVIQGQINLLGLLGLNDSVRNGYRLISLSFQIKGDGTDEELRAIVEQSRSRSAVYDLLTNGTQVSIETQVG